MLGKTRLFHLHKQEDISFIAINKCKVVYQVASQSYAKVFSSSAEARHFVNQLVQCAKY